MNIQLGHKVAAWLRHNTLLHREMLEEIFENAIATGKHVVRGEEHLDNIDTRNSSPSPPPNKTSSDFLTGIKSLDH